MIYTLFMKVDARPIPGDETGNSLFDSLVAIPEKNAILAVLFPQFWMMYHKLWFALMIYTGGVVISAALLTTKFAIAIPLLAGLPSLYIFLEGNQLRRQKLRANGYEMVGIVDAPERRYAIEKFLYQWQAPKVRPSKPAAISGALPRDEPGISMFVETGV